MQIKSVFFILILAFSFSACNFDNSLVVENSTPVATNDFTVDSFAFYENALLLDSLNVDLRLALATNYYTGQQFEKAISHLLIIHQIDKKNITALMTLGNIYYDTEQYNKAIEFYEKTLALDNKNVNVRCDMATCYLSIQKPEKACELLKENIKINSNHAQSHHNLSIVYKELGMQKEAEEEMAIFNQLSK